MLEAIGGPREVDCNGNQVTIRRTDGSRCEIRLPFTTRRVFSPLILSAVPLAIASAACFSIGVWAAFGAVTTGRPEDLILFSIFTIVSALFAWLFLACAGSLSSHLADLGNGNGVITLSDDALWDKRELSSPVPWHEFSKVEVHSTRYGVTVRLWPRNTLPRRRMSSLARSHFHRPFLLMDRLLVVETRFFDQPDEIVALAIAEMVKRHGGEAHFVTPYSSRQL